MRYDTDNGYVIFRNGVPYQAAVRLHGFTDPMGFDNLVCWKLDTDGPMSGGLAAWIAERFAGAINEEAQRFLTRNA